MEQQSGHQDDASSTAARAFPLPKETLHEPFSPDSARLRFHSSRLRWMSSVWGWSCTLTLTHCVLPGLLKWLNEANQRGNHTLAFIDAHVRL